MKTGVIDVAACTKNCSHPLRRFEIQGQNWKLRCSPQRHARLEVDRAERSNRRQQPQGLKDADESRQQPQGRGGVSICNANRMMMESLGSNWRKIKQLIKIAIFPWPVLEFMQRRVGSEYGIGLGQKLSLLHRLLQNSTQTGSATTFYEHIMIVQGVLLTPPELKGDVAEFGCFKGAATSSLSLVCALTGRRLKVFDSFEGLPEPNEKVTHLSSGQEVPYRVGDYLGTLDEVKRSVHRGGNLSVCEFIKGFFDKTLPLREAEEQYVLIFEDADLPQSVRTVLEYSWPRLREYGLFFCHEARDKEVVQLFYDKTFWREKLSTEPPGFVGSGCGLPLDFRESQRMLGYAIKLPA